MKLKLVKGEDAHENGTAPYQDDKYRITVLKELVAPQGGRGEVVVAADSYIDYVQSENHQRILDLYSLL